MNNSRTKTRHRQTWKTLFSEKGIRTKMVGNIVSHSDDECELHICVTYARATEIEV